MSVVRAESPLSVAGERTALLGLRSRSSSSSSRRRQGCQLGNVRRTLAAAGSSISSDDSSRGSNGSRESRSSSSSSPALAAATSTPTTIPQASYSSSSSSQSRSPSTGAGADVTCDGDSSSSPAETTFRELFRDRLPDWLLTRLEHLGFAAPTLVQRQALEVILDDEKYDAVLHAQTGSGKTLAFLLPLFAMIEPSRSAVQGLVVVPTRELGLQVAGVAKRLAAGTGSGRDKKIQVCMIWYGVEW